MTIKPTTQFKKDYKRYWYDTQKIKLLKTIAVYLVRLGSHSELFD